MERKRIIIAFGDILGFGTWHRRAANQPEISGPFLQKFYDELQAFQARSRDLYLKYLGDGIMILKELPETKKSIGYSREFIRNVGFLNSRLLRIIRFCPFPAPEGFRTRVASGYVDKIMIHDPLDRKKRIPEYVGYSINLAQRLLEISPSVPFICHESVVKIVGRKRALFRFKRLPEQSNKPRGIDSEDISGLWVIEF